VTCMYIILQRRHQEHQLKKSEANSAHFLIYQKVVKKLCTQLRLSQGYDENQKARAAKSV